MRDAPSLDVRSPALICFMSPRTQSPFTRGVRKSCVQLPKTSVVTRTQNSRSFSTRLSGGLLAIRAELMAPIEMPAIQFGWDACLHQCLIDASLVSAYSASSFQKQCDALEGRTTLHAKFIVMLTCDNIEKISRQGNNDPRVCQRPQGEMWMTKEKISVVDKLQSSRFSDLKPVGGMACKEIVSTICGQRPAQSMG